MDRNIRLTIEYDGTHYHGWQTQADSARPTIQDAIEAAIKSIAGESVRVHGSGRTDARVHAHGQVANFVTAGSMPPEAWAPALNHFLAHDVRVLESREAVLDFHARFSAVGKVYCYRLFLSRFPTALHRNYAWHIALPLDIERMRKALAKLLGEHDFSSFRGAGCSAKSPIRHIRRAELQQDGLFTEIRLEANGFLQHMVRNITGTVVEVGLGRFTPDDVERILQAKNRSLAGKTAPPQGLYLESVMY
jgi:tRNA pseudouridine38-40 synthase